MRRIKLMADYQSFPLWEASPGSVGNINPAELPLSPDLQAQLEKWADAYDATLNLDDPSQSGFPSPHAQVEFERMGERLGDRLRAELGPEFDVVVKI